MKKYLSERREALILAVLVMLGTLVPYFLGYAAEGDLWRFTGVLIGVEDGNSYIAKMLSGAAGYWLFRSPYSAEFQKGMVAFLPYLLLGKLSAPPAQHEQLVALYHGFRFLAGILAILATYDFLAVFCADKKLRFWGLVAAVLGGGSGWILVLLEKKELLGSLPLDFYSPEGFGFLGLMGLPHLALGRALFLWGFTAYLGRKSGTGAGLLWLLLGFFQPMYIPVAWVVIGLHSAALWLLVRWKPDYFGPARSCQPGKIAERATQAVLISSPMVIYTAISFLSDPYLLAWSEQNRLPSPHWIQILLAYGLILPFAVAGIVGLVRQKSAPGWLLAVWLAAFPALVYAPVNTQRRLAEGIWVVLVAGMVSFFAGRDRRLVWVRGLSLLVLPTALLLFSGSVARALSPDRPVFLPGKEVQAYLALAEDAAPNAIVLTEFSTGNSLPAWAPVRVVLGHGPETVNLEAWQEILDQAFGSGQGTACKGLLQPYAIDYVFWGPAERERWNWLPGQEECLKAIYRSDDYAIYEVKE